MSHKDKGQEEDKGKEETDSRGNMGVSILKTLENEVKKKEDLQKQLIKEKEEELKKNMKRAEDLERELLQKLEEARAHKPDLYPDAVGLPGPGAKVCHD